MKRVLVAFLSLACPSAAAAQGAGAGGAGPLVLERLESRFVLAPDFKVTEVDGDTGQLAGGYIGWLAEDTLLIAGALYSLVNGPDDAELTYGGLLIGWNTPEDKRIQFGARGLVGVGRAALGRDITPMRRIEVDPNVGGFARFGARPGAPAISHAPTTFRIRGSDDFFVFEPQLTLMMRMTEHVGLAWGLGYRLTGSTEFAGDRLNGVTGSLALQIAAW